MEVIGEALEDIADAIQGDPEVIGALHSLNPRLAQGVMKAAAAVNPARQMRDIQGNLEMGRAIDTFLPFTGGANSFAAAAAVVLTGTPLRNFWPTQIAIETGHDDVTISTITIAGIPMLAAQTGVIPATVFNPLVPRPFALNWQVVPANQSLIVTGTNASAATATPAWGGAYGKYTLQ